MYKMGDMVRWRTPIEPMDSYGTLLSIKRGVATVREIGYYQGRVTAVPFKYIRKLKRKGGDRLGGSNEKYSKRSITETKL